jgi:O-antigen/teichoic acid export membrane protein/CelD/BcsL family acetyltransferase involved in cellulose biosynthesis
MSSDAALGNPSNQMLKGSMWMVLMRWAVRSLGFVNTMVLVRLLQPSDFGVLAIATIISGFFEIFSETGQRLAIIRHPNPTREVLNSAWTVQIAICTTLAVLVWLCAPLAQTFFHNPHAPGVVQLLALRALLMGFENIGTVVFRRDLNFTREFKYNVYQRLATVIVTIILAVVLRSYWALAIGMVAGQAGTVLISYAMHPYRPWFGISKVRELWSFSLWILAGQTTSYFQSRMDQIALGPVIDAAQMGRYFVASDVATLPISEVLIPMGRAQYPVFVRLTHQPEKLKQSYLETLSLTAVLAWATGVGLALVSHDFAAVVLGAKWLSLAPLMPWLCLSAALFALSNTALTLHQATGGAALFARQSWLRTIIMAILIFAAARGGNLTHVVMARFASALIFAPLVFVTLRRVVGVTLRDVWRENQRPAIAALGMSLVVLGLQYALTDISVYARLFLCVAAGMVTYAGLLAALWWMSGKPPSFEAQVFAILRSRLSGAHTSTGANGAALRARSVPIEQLSPAQYDAWDTLLAAQHPQGNAFLSSSFARCAARAWPGAQACLIEDEAGLAAVLAYQAARGPTGLLMGAERIGEEMNDSFGLVARAGFTIAPRSLLTLAGLNHFYFTHLAEDQKAFGLTGEKPGTGLHIELPQGGAAYWDALTRADRKFTSDTERRLRKAQEDLGPMRFTLMADDPAALLEDLLAHKREQYLRTGKGDWLAAPGRTRLLRELAKTRAPDCSGQLSILSFGDSWAAMHFGLRSRQTLHYWFPVYNPALNTYAPGRLLLHAIIHHAADAGIAVIDRGIGESAAKRDFASVPRSYFSGVWYRPGLGGLSCRLLQSAQWRLKSLRKN